MRLAIISDIHEDIVSLELALHKIERMQCDEIVCLGDISGFSVPYYRYFDTRNAHECLRLIRENCKIIIAGNHDLYAARKIPNEGTIFDFPENWYDLDYYERKTISEDKVWLYDHDELDPLYTHSDIEFLSTLPETFVLKINHLSILFSHYVYPNLSGALKNFHHVDKAFESHISYIEKNECNLGFVGHAHYTGLFVATKEKSFRKMFNRKYLINEIACAVIPSIAGNKMGNGFCLVDTEEGWMKGVRI